MTATELFEKIRAVTADPAGGVTRPSYGFNETKALKVLEHEADERELHPLYDAAGNLWIPIHGTSGVVPAAIATTHDAGMKPYVLIGSHVDSVANGGNYDGLAGVIAGLEVLTRLRDVRPRPLVQVVALRGEESAWFGAPYKGSKALFGKFDSAEIREAIVDATANQINLCGRLGEPLFDPKLVKAFLELHIEQGPVLEIAQQDPITPVTSIRGNVRMTMRCRGRADHSGTTPMGMRRDAIQGAAVAVRNIDDVCAVAAGHRQQRDLVGTCGVFNTTASASPSKVADQVDFVVEFRSDLDENLDWALGRYHENLRYFEKKHDVIYEVLKQVRSPAVDLFHGIHKDVYQHVLAAVKETTMRFWPMASGAGHDAAVFAQHGIPAGMPIFVRNQNGSHNPNEAMQMADFILGVDALERAVRRIANV